jgi:hypothetical protein
LEFVRISERGQNALAAPDLGHYLNVDKLLAVKLHTRIDGKVRQHFSAGDPDTAVLLATKAVEVAVREAADLGNELFGTKLMAAAFKPGEGPLHDSEIPVGEQAGVMALLPSRRGFEEPEQPSASRLRRCARGGGGRVLCRPAAADARAAKAGPGAGS